MVVTSKYNSSSWSETASSNVAETLTGSHKFEIMGYSLIKGSDNYIPSAIFTAVGYDWIIRYYPQSTSNRSSYIGLLLELRSEAKNLTVGIEFLLENDNVERLGKKIQTFKGSGSTGGFDHFMERNSVDSGGYVKDDCLKIECTVTIWKTPRLLSSIVVPPSDLSKQFGALFVNQEGADVTFEVDGKIFGAHRYVLAARSSVFKAQFFGEMKETTSKIHVIEIEAPVFEAMLHFIYTDSLPEISEIIKDYSDGDDCNAIFQHLLAAADRYGLERLKIICAEMLFENINESNAIAIWDFSGQYNCPQLRNACLDFILRPRTLRALRARGFEHLVQTCPLKDLIERFGSS